MIASLCQHATRDEAVLCPFYRPLKAEQVGPCHGPNAFDLSNSMLPQPQRSCSDLPTLSSAQHGADSLAGSFEPAPMRRCADSLPELPALSAPTQRVTDLLSSPSVSSPMLHNTGANMATLQNSHGDLQPHDLQDHGLQHHNLQRNDHPSGIAQTELQHSLQDAAPLSSILQSTNALPAPAASGVEPNPAATLKHSLREVPALPELHILILTETVLAYPEALTVAEIFARVGGHFAPAVLLEFARAIRHMEDDGLLEPVAPAFVEANTTVRETGTAIAGAMAVTTAKSTVTQNKSMGINTRPAGATPVQPAGSRRCIRTAVTRQGREHLFSLLMAGALPDEAQGKLLDAGVVVAELSPVNGSAEEPCSTQKAFAQREIAATSIPATRTRAEEAIVEPEPAAEITPEQTSSVSAKTWVEKQIALESLTKKTVAGQSAGKESAALAPLQEIRIAEPGPTAHADPHGTHAHGKGGDAASKWPSPPPFIEPTAALEGALREAEQNAVQGTHQEATGSSSALEANANAQLHIPARSSYVSLIERYLPELYTPQRSIAQTTIAPAQTQAPSLNAATLRAAHPYDGGLIGAASRTAHLQDCERNTPAQHDRGPGGPEISSGPTAEFCESCGGPAQRQCPCGAQRCASHFYEADGAQARGANGFCAECVDLIREQQYGEERYGVAGGA